MPEPIGIFTSQTAKDKEGNPVSCFGCNDELLLAALYQASAEVTGPGLTNSYPDDGSVVHKVGEIQILPVDDEQRYVLKDSEPVGKPEVNRKPSGTAGTWDVQSIVFSKEKFTMEQASTWLNDHGRFGNYGVDETDTSYRFRQYEPEHFDEYRTGALAEGINAVYGRIASSGGGVEDDAKEKALALIEASITEHKNLQDLNDAILKNGVTLLPGSAHVYKSTVEEQEERYILSLVLEPNNGSDAPLNPDTQSDVYSIDSIRKTAHGWMEKGGSVDLMHDWRGLGKEVVRVLESYVAPCDMVIGEGDAITKIFKGTWMLALRIVDDELWSAVKAGKIGAYSIGGAANRKPFKAPEGVAT